MKLAGILLIPGLLQAQSGHWEGVIKQEGQDALFSIDLSDQPDWNGAFLVPGHDAPPLPLSAIEVHAPTVQFEIRDLPGNPTFKGTIAEQGTSIRGTVSQGGGIAVFEMRRTGDAQVHAMPVSTPLDAALLGDWTGTLPQAHPIALVLHLRTDESGLGSGTLDTADRRARNLVLSGIRKNGASLSFDVRLIGGTFHGERSPDGGRIVGTWTQNGVTAPLTFERQKP
jgi:hypothetical protein